MAEIVLAGVAKRFADGTVALHPTDVAIGDGELFILVGPSGCGKSTLLNLIAGLDEVSEGEVRIDGRVVNGVDPKDRNIAMVFQSYAIYPHLSVRENLSFPLQMARLPKDQIAARVARAAEILELGPLLDRRPASLSGGQRQRVAMGRAIVREPAAFLLDEPLSNLDARLRVQMRAEIARLQRELRTTMVYVTHDQTEAMTLGDRIAVLRAGRVQQIGTPRELYERPRNVFVATFIGEPPMNVVPGTVRNGRLVLPFGELALSPAQRQRIGDRVDVLAGIRPEHWSHAASPAGGADSGTAFDATVELVEWLGADLYVHFSAVAAGARFPLIARVDPALAVARGSRIALCVDPARLNLFDSRTEESLSETQPARLD
ncbi:MAG TPA: sn-glycerol-3-phosphate ABC transporter ATP-binding protein UgpC [Burkholderiaceae bacterium]|nr:sn-glycerol-3-phosphate ABC transporter ATP-binding protein UgpC [Burkholderiaceae bacterium]